MEEVFRAARVVIVILISLSARSASSQEGYKISVDAAMVTTDVTVANAAGSEFRAQDFLIYDNGVEQQISHFSRNQMPLAVAIVIDRSLTVQKYMSMLQIAAVSTLRRLKPEDQVALFAFDYSISKLADLSEDRGLIAEKIGKIKNQLGTNIYDAIYEAAKYLKKKAPQRRRAIIFISDNIRMGSSGHNAKSAREELLETAITLYNIKTPADFGPPMYWAENRRSLLETDPEVKRMAAETGGEVLDMQTGLSIQSALEKVISNLRLQYTIGFNPSEQGQTGIFRRLAVKLAAKDRCPGCQILTRSGYYPGISVPLSAVSSATDLPEAATQKSEESLIERNIVIAGNSNLDLTDIPFTVSTAKQPDANGQPRIRVDFQIDFSGIAVKKIADRYFSKLRITVFYADSKGKILGSDRRILEGQLREETYRQAIRSGIAFSTTVPAQVPQQILKIVVYDEESDKVGSKMVKLP